LPPKQRSDYQVEVGGEIRLAGRSRARRGADYKQATSRQQSQVPSGEMPETPSDRIPDHSRAHRLADNKADARRIGAAAGSDQQVARDELPPGPAAAAGREPEVSTPPHPCGCRKHGEITHAAASHADARAPLPAPRPEDRAAGPGAHAQPEAMSLRPAAVVRLKSTLTHWSSRCGGFVSGHAGHRKAQAAALSLADFNNRQPETHPSDSPYLRQAML
jgi:hypothetical protein